MAELEDGMIDLVLTSPPYNAGKDYGDFDDEKDDSDYLNWYLLRAEEIYRVHGQGYAYITCTVNQLWTLRPLWESVGYRFEELLLWHGPNYAGNKDVMKHHWRQLYEPIMMFRKGKRLPMLNNIHIPNTDAILEFTRPQSSFKGDLKRVHPTQHPAELYYTLIARTPGQLVFDPYLGSGTTLKACRMANRDGIGFEVNRDFESLIKRSIRDKIPSLEEFGNDGI
ncbi:site-specific DNA-methyltransferase [Candidatus Bathyarchaeota archaeon]|nr:site-specific DNA-methyltransferase [Candidatus Bathyarchaeota archaeon]